MPHESRSSCISYHVRLALQHSGVPLRSMAMEVVAHYHATVPLHARTVTFHTGGDVHADIKANAQILQRMFDGGSVRLPVDLEESVLLSLPSAFRQPALADVSARLGLLAAPLPRNDNARAATTTGDLVRETGELLTALAPALADGRIDADDAPHCKRALKEIRDVQAQLAALEMQLVTCLAQAPAPTHHNVAQLARKAAG